MHGMHKYLIIDNAHVGELQTMDMSLRYEVLHSTSYCRVEFSMDRIQAVNEISSVDSKLLLMC
jgi:hypothetical protein